MPIPKWLDTDDVARLLGVDDRSVRRLVKKGILKRGALGFDPCKAVSDFVAHREGIASAAAGKGELGAAQTETYKERAQIMRLQRERLEGSLVPLQEVRATWSQAFILARTRMLAIPSKIAARMALLNKPADCMTLMDSEIREGLEDIAGTEVIANGRPV